MVMPISFSCVVFWGAVLGAGSTGCNLNYGAVLETATDIAKGMRHLHANEVLHSDLKVSIGQFSHCVRTQAWLLY